MNFDFDKATRVEPIGDGRYAARVHDGWDIGGNANGGYLLALVAGAASKAAARALPVAISCHYLGPINDADVVINTQVVKSGKSFATVHVTMWAGERVIVTAIVTCGNELPGGTLHHSTHVAPDLPSFESCVPRAPSTSATVETTHRDDAPPMPGLMSNIDVRLHPSDTGFATGIPSGHARVRGWCAFRDARPVDALALTLFCDAFPPAMFNLAGAPGWVPTVQLSWYLRGLPDGAPVRGEFVTTQIANGMFEEDGTLWTESGMLLAQSRQLALLPR